jgi:Calcineurin-like phosphoesterase
MSHIACCILMLLLLAAERLPAAQTEWKNVERVVAVGDIHGDFAGLVEVLRSAGVIDQNNHWIAGKTHLVQTGDVPDRGADTRKAMDLLMDLEKEAAKAGGYVHALIGNHEAMNLYGDLRYTTPGEFAAFATNDSERVRAGFWKQEAKKSPRPNFDDQRKWEAEHPLGWFEQRIAYSSKGVYGKWIRSHNAVIKINDTIYMHGGISPRYVSEPLEWINEMVAAELNDLTSIKKDGPVMGTDSPLWYRGLSQDDGPEIAAHVDKVLAAYGIKRIVVSHTVMPGAIIPRFGGKVIVIDVGITAVYGGHRACLLLEDGVPYAIHRGVKLDLPSGGAEYVSYLKKALALEPPGSPLAKFTADAEVKLAAAK